MSEENKPIFQIYVNDQEIGYETELGVEESVFWLETIKQMILSRVVGAEVPDDE